MRPRFSWALALLVVALVAIPILEVWLLIQVGQTIGALPTLALLLVTALAGGWLLHHEGTRAWKALTAAFGNGRMPTGELADAALVLVGGVLLLLPGFFTDLIGLFFLLPFTRPYARRFLTFLVARRLNRFQTATRSQASTVIEGETVDRAESDSETGSRQVIQGEVIAGEVVEDEE